MKRPAFQFYPADWRKDAELQSCSIAAQGLWINALCIAHECDPYGHLTVNSKPMTPAQLGRLCGLAAKECDGLLAELLDAGVASKTAEGAIFSRRMVRDEEVRAARAAGGEGGAQHGAKGAAHGAKGGRPPQARGVSNPPSYVSGTDERGVNKPPSYPPPSSSSSSASAGVLPTSSPDSLASASTAGAGARAMNDSSVTPAGQACRAMRDAGCLDVNPSHPNLLAALAEGVTPQQLGDLARELPGKRFPYLIQTARSRNAEVQAVAANGGPARSARPSLPERLDAITTEPSL